MRRALHLAAALALFSAGAAGATSTGQALPHDTVLGCASIRQVVANLNEGRLKALDESLGPTFYSDEFGRVDDSEAAAFLHSMRHSQGKPDRRKMRIFAVYTLHRDRVQPVYLVVLAREAWHETSFEQDDMLTWNEVPDPHYGVDTSHWLVQFHSSDVRSLREVPEMYHVGAESARLIHCRDD